MAKEKVRAFTLHNDGSFVARIQLPWTTEDGDNGMYKQDGYHDICKHAERTVNLSDTNIPLGSSVYLHAYVVLGKGKDADKSFEYAADGKIAEYTISGTTLINKLKFDGLK